MTEIASCRSSGSRPQRECREVALARSDRLGLRQSRGGDRTAASRRHGSHRAARIAARSLQGRCARNHVRRRAGRRQRPRRQAGARFRRGHSRCVHWPCCRDPVAAIRSLRRACGCGSRHPSLLVGRAGRWAARDASGLRPDPPRRVPAGESGGARGDRRTRVRGNGPKAHGSDVPPRTTAHMDQTEGTVHHSG